MEDALEVDLGEHLQRRGRQLQALSAQRDLLAGFLAADVDHAADHLAALGRSALAACGRGGRSQVGERLQQQGGLADARVATDQHDPTADQAAAEHAVEFIQPGGLARLLARLECG